MDEFWELSEVYKGASKMCSYVTETWQMSCMVIASFVLGWCFANRKNIYRIIKSIRGWK